MSQQQILTTYQNLKPYPPLSDELSRLGYECRLGPEIAPDSGTPERNHHGQVILPGRLTAALRRLNPDLPLEAVEEIVRRIERDETPSLVEENRRLHRMIIEDADVQLARADGGFHTVQATLIDLADTSRNDWLVTSQFTVIENGKNRRPDLVVFVNGLALAVLELKNPGSENATLACRR